MQLDVPDHLAPMLKLALVRAQIYTDRIINKAPTSRLAAFLAEQAIELDRLAVCIYDQTSRFAFPASWPEAD